MYVGAANIKVRSIVQNKQYWINNPVQNKYKLQSWEHCYFKKDTIRRSAASYI